MRSYGDIQEYVRKESARRAALYEQAATEVAIYVATEDGERGRSERREIRAYQLDIGACGRYRFWATGVEAGHHR